MVLVLVYPREDSVLMVTVNSLKLVGNSYYLFSNSQLFSVRDDCVLKDHESFPTQFFTRSNCSYMCKHRCLPRRVIYDPSSNFQVRDRPQVRHLTLENLGFEVKMIV